MKVVKRINPESSHHKEKNFFLFCMYTKLYIYIYIYIYIYLFNNLRYAYDTTFMAENKELRSLLMKVKEERDKVDLKLNIQKTKIVASGPITSWQIDGKTVEAVRDFILGGSKNHCRW